MQRVLSLKDFDMKKFLLSLGFFAFVLAPLGVSADTDPLNDPLQQLKNTGDVSAVYNTNEEEASLTLIIARFIRSLFGLLGIGMVILTVFAGFQWMTAGGDPGKVDGAKKLLVNATIGFAIIMMAFAISSFVVTTVANSASSTEVEAGQP